VVEEDAVEGGGDVDAEVCREGADVLNDADVEGVDDVTGAVSAVGGTAEAAMADVGGEGAVDEGRRRDMERVRAPRGAEVMGGILPVVSCLG
jgi:hypothetical protein